jgi:histidinol-phosphate aminotransferase
MKNKFTHFQYLKKIQRLKEDKINRHNKIRLDANERISPFSQNFMKLIKKKINSNFFTAYPEVENLYKLLAKTLKLKISNIFLTSGSDTGMKHCFEVFIRPNSKIITLDPTFGMVNVYAKLFRAKQIKISFNNKLSLNYNKLINSINKSVSMIMFANPNSPTGTIIKSKDIIEIIKKAKKNNCYVVIDEAYFGFYNKSSLHLIKKFDNLIILRTFSKAYGLAGLRSGYIVSSKKNIDQLYKFRPMYEINALAALVSEEIIKDGKILKKYVSDTSSGKKYLIKQLNNIGLESYDTFSNFILINFKTKKNQQRIFKLLTKNKILVRFPPDILACKNYLRFTLGPLSYMKMLVKVLKK